MTPKGRIAAHLWIFSVSIAALSAWMFLQPHSIMAQVGPAEIKNPKLKALQQTYLSDLIDLRQSISSLNFPFKLSLNRYVGLDPKDQVGADARGLEFVVFHDRTLLKVTANYNAAFNVDALTPNQRGGRVLNDVILPMLRLLPGHFGQDTSFDGFGFEIGYHVQTHRKGYEYEGKENLVVVFDKADGLQYASLNEDAGRQEILNRSDIYINGEPFGLALGSSAPFEIEALVYRPTKKEATPAASGQVAAPPAKVPAIPANAGAQLSAPPAPAKTAVPTPVSSPAAVNPVSSPAAVNIDALLEKYQSELEILNREGTAKFHFVDYAPPSFIVIRDQAALQATLRNPEAFDKDSTSIYRRAARTFDLFLAPRLKWIISKIPQTPDFSILSISIVNDLISAKSNKSSEAVEFILPLKEARQFVAADITNQDLIDKGTVLVNGVRIALNLAQVE